MKFIGQHRFDLFELMKKHGFHHEQFSYVKKRGRIYVKTNDPNVLFGYLRKKYTHLNPITKQWEHGATYKVQLNTAREVDRNEWSELLDLFEDWVKGIDKQILD